MSWSVRCLFFLSLRGPFQETPNGRIKLLILRNLQFYNQLYLSRIMKLRTLIPILIILIGVLEIILKLIRFYKYEQGAILYMYMTPTWLIFTAIGVGVTHIICGFCMLNKHIRLIPGVIYTVVSIIILSCVELIVSM